MVNSLRRNCKFYFFHYFTRNTTDKNQEGKGKEKMHHRTLQNTRTLQNPSQKQCLQRDLYKEVPMWLCGCKDTGGGGGYRESRDGAVVRALGASHQCGTGSIPDLGVMWVEFVVGSRPCSERFSPGTPVFLPPQKPTFQISI